MAWRFYVYALIDALGAIAYVGKGSGYRLSSQRSKYRLQGHEVARFKRERDAYAFERVCIKDMRPFLNKHPGGNGSMATPKRAPRGWTPETLAKSRRDVARFLIERFPVRLGASKVEQLRKIAYG